ncbi:hypothetical protein D3C79_933200 [compost metagenome]
MPDGQRRQLGAVSLEHVEYRVQLLEGNVAAALRLAEVDGQRIQLVAMPLQPAGEVLDLLAGYLGTIRLPAGMQHLV